MGGSGSGGGGGISFPPTGDDCPVKISFQVAIQQQDTKDVWSNCQVGDEVDVSIDQDDLPLLEIKKVSDKFRIGMVPAQYSKIMKCINLGWEYKGKIINKNGNERNPQITVDLRGEQ